MKSLPDRKELHTFPAALVLAYAGAALLNAALTIAKETILPLKNALAALGGHHWPAHTVIVALVFFIGTIVLARTTLPTRLLKTNRAAVRLLLGSTFVAATAIAVFFLFFD